MDRDSINLFKKRFLEFNRARYQDDVNWSIALKSLTVDDINVLEYRPDPESKYRTVLTEVQSDKFTLTGLDQQYTKAYFGTDTVALLSDRTIYPDLVSVLNLNTMGVFFYKNDEEPEYPHVVVATNFLRKWDDGLPFITEVMNTINENTFYDLKLNECTITLNEEDTSGDREVVDVVIDNHTIWGSIKVGQIPAAYPLGTYPYEYLGKFNEFHLMGKEELLELANIPDGSMDGVHRLKTPLIWLKFRYYGKVLYVPKYPILTEVSWDLLNARKMVGGKTIITAADGNEYRLRLLNISDNDGEDEWENLIKRCVMDSGKTEWEAFDYASEMQYGYYDPAQTKHIYSSVLTEGFDESEQRYLVGLSGGVNVRPNAAIAPNEKYKLYTANTHTYINYAGWLPVLELRGCDPIQTDTIHPHWIDLRDPIPEQNYAEQAPDPGMVFQLRLLKTEWVGPEDIDIEVDTSTLNGAQKINLIGVAFESDIEEPDFDIDPIVANGASKINLLTVEMPALDEGILDLEVDATQDAFYIGYKKHTTQFASVKEGQATVLSESDAGIKHISFNGVSVPKTELSSPYGNLTPQP